MSFESDKPFNDFVHFHRGIRRSGRFSIKEATLLEEAGTAMTELYNEKRQPKDDVEKEFVEQVFGKGIPTSIYAKVYRKYLLEITPKKTHNLTTTGEDEDSSYDSSDDSID